MLEFNEEEHRYFDGGVELPSVTTVTDEEFAQIVASRKAKGGSEWHN